MTEADLLKRLQVRYNERAGNGYAWAFIPKVRSAAAFDARRTIDAYAMALWPSRGLELLAFEIKCSRSDWLRELKKPEKAEEFCQLAGLVGRRRLPRDRRQRAHRREQAGARRARAAQGQAAAGGW